MFNAVDAKKKDEFLDKAKAKRQERHSEKHKDEAAIKIQALVRRFLVRCSFNRRIRQELDTLIQMPENREDEYKPKLKPGTVLLLNSCQFTHQSRTGFSVWADNLRYILLWRGLSPAVKFNCDLFVCKPIATIEVSGDE